MILLLFNNKNFKKIIKLCFTNHCKTKTGINQENQKKDETNNTKNYNDERMHIEYKSPSEKKHKIIINNYFSVKNLKYQEKNKNNVNTLSEIYESYQSINYLLIHIKKFFSKKLVQDQKNSRNLYSVR